MILNFKELSLSISRFFRCTKTFYLKFIKNSTDYKRKSLIILLYPSSND